MTTPRIEEIIRQTHTFLPLDLEGREEYLEYLEQALTQTHQAGIDEAVKIVVGWREKDWPKNFDRYTAQLIADDLERRLALQDNKQEV